LSGRIDLVVGLGNPGPDYEHTRHNVGFWFVDVLARVMGASFKLVTRLNGHVADVSFPTHKGRLFKPATFMNHSGRAVAAISRYYRIAAQNILIVHDDIDLEPGTVRLKKGGGDGGHNGLRDIIAALGGNRDFMRLRIGVGHPGSADKVIDYVLQKPSSGDIKLITTVIENSIDLVPVIVEGESEQAMNQLHRRTTSSTQDPAAR
jgi:PTH1 family peptidyl-tRNA hydrolase